MLNALKTKMRGVSHTLNWILKNKNYHTLLFEKKFNALRLKIINYFASLTQCVEMCISV